tara:strand:+ start:674 stop:1186 length:513 start_codon:yes stop_codon:yes gene_type:complete
MACDISAGRLRACKDSLGGNSEFYLYNDLVDPFTVVAGEATAMNVALTANYLFELEGDGNNLIQSMVGDRSSGSKVNTQTITLVLKKMDAATNAQFNLLVAGFSQAVIKDRNGNYLSLGADDGIDWTVEAATGGAKADGNIYTLTGVATTADLSPILDSATVTAFLAVTV